jgi:hypothetical protein
MTSLPSSSILSTIPLRLIFPMYPDLHNWPYSALLLLILVMSPIVHSVLWESQ